MDLPNVNCIVFSEISSLANSLKLLSQTLNSGLFVYAVELKKNNSNKNTLKNLFILIFIHSNLVLIILIHCVFALKDPVNGIGTITASTGLFEYFFGK